MGEYANLLTLPDEFALLLHKPGGTCCSSANPNAATAAAEIGELVLRGRVAAHGTAVQLLDTASSGHPWMDQLLVDFAAVAGRENHPVELGWWLALRSTAFATHRSVLVERGVLRVERRKLLGFLPDDRYHPDHATRTALLAELHSLARGELPVDDRLALLAALLHHTGLAHPLGFDRRERTHLRTLADAEPPDAHLTPEVQAAIHALTTIPTAPVTPNG
ncbi:GPP34 family phosphoprotein [Saccharopolyspora sp. NPDC000359]|uniref:GOLPH3/VPS74 family protein n=1 Tax=Saccharopolyspora sp. NPDC000359 TaxID=3154251 RepID=UPI00331E2E21